MRLKTKKDELVFDIWRSMTLAHVINFWGMPEYRFISKHREHPFPIEVYVFPIVNGVYKLCTVGLSIQGLIDVSYFGKELILVLPILEMTDRKMRCVVNYFLDITVHYLAHCHDGISLISENKLTPPSWNTKSIFIDSPRGECEDFETVSFGEKTVIFKWIIPITQNEYSIIKNKGVEEFDAYINKEEIELIDVSRVD
jgi:hypothetical protein